jgi:CBS domain-containing protein
MICPFCRTENIEGADECVNCGQALYGLDLPGSKGSVAPDFVNQPVSRLPLRTVPTLGASDPVGLAVRLMQRSDTSCVLVMNNGDLAGIITGRDILEKVAGQADDLNAVTCAQIMTPDPQCLHDEDTIALALNLMASGRSHHVQILVNEKPVGVIDVNDVFRHLSPYLV